VQKSKYRDLLISLKNSSYSKTKSLCFFSAQKGFQYNNNVMVVGRVVNEWGDNFQIDNLQIDSLLELLFESTSQDECPLEWIHQASNSGSVYNSNKSAFWRVIKNLSQVINKLDASENWASKVVWSNLYKIAPSEGGNPGDRLCEYQFENCNELLKSEIEEYQPKYIIFLTGDNWFDGFLSEHIYLNAKANTKWVDASGTLTLNGFTSKFVVAKHPQGKPEDDLLREIFSELAIVI